MNKVFLIGNLTRDVELAKAKNHKRQVLEQILKKNALKSCRLALFCYR
jgi:single-stranded DNA-binding protein